MRFGLFALTTSSLLLSLALLGGCGKPAGDKDTPAGDEDEGGGGKGKPKVKLTALTRGTGVISGKVKLDGDVDLAALNEKFRKQVNELIAKEPASAHCLSKDAPAEDREEEQWVLGKDNGVKYAFVFLQLEPGSYFQIKDDDPAVLAVKGKEAVMDQPYCAFHPRALVVFPQYHPGLDKNGKPEKKSTGQKFIIKNSAPIAHNSNYSGEPENSGKNESIPPGKSLDGGELKPSLTPVTVKCNIHGWMYGYVFVLDHPYAAVTDKDGYYEIKNVPEGKYRVVAWHQSAEPKFLPPGEGAKGVTVEMGAGEKKEVNFEAKP
jgi:hypothetical protein